LLVFQNLSIHYFDICLNWAEELMYFEARARTTKHCGIIGGEFVNFS